ncbi:MAG: metallophosphoesterase [Candidatus Bathyarchaeia archaeon]
MVNKVRLFHAVDVHGSEMVWRKWLSIPKVHKADILLLCGDLTGKLIIPIIEESPGRYKTMVYGRWINASGEDELKKLMDKITFSGFYTHVCNQEEYDELMKNPKRVDELFRNYMRERLQRWLSMVDEKLSKDVTVVMMPGNDDFQYVDEIIESSSYVKNLEGKVYDIGERWQLGGTGYSNITPWKCPRDVPEDELFNRLESLAAQVTDMNHFVLHTHCPPYDTKLDQAPQLDENLKVVYKGGGTMLVPVGSTAVRKFIEKYQFPLGLHGHIHESRAVDRIGKTLVINPGSEYITGTLSAVLVNLDEKGVKGYRFILT